MAGMRSILALIYVVIGAVVAQQHHYLAHLSTVSDVISAALAIGLWPLVLLQFNLRVK